MVILKELGENLLICANKHIIVYNIVSSTEKIIQLQEENDTKEKVTTAEPNEISAVATSCNNAYIAILKGKQVFVYNDDLTQFKILSLKRAGNSITFTKQDDIIVAEKTGDVFLFKLTNDSSNGELIFGHLSVLLDVTMTENGKFVLTSDRDEKIRVSHYPNTYNIQSFCLGHTEFVMKVIVINEVLISAGGDGKLIIWDFMEGRKLYEINTNLNIDGRRVIERFAEEMQSEKCEVTYLPIIDMQVKSISSNCFIVGVQLYNVNSIFLYLIEILKRDEFKHSFMQCITFETKLNTFSLNNNLFVITNSGIIMYKFNTNKFELVQHENLNTFCVKHKNLIHHCDIDITTFYKRKFDNVQEYMERKRQRIEGK